MKMYREMPGEASRVEASEGREGNGPANDEAFVGIDC